MNHITRPLYTFQWVKSPYGQPLCPQPRSVVSRVPTSVDNPKHLPRVVESTQDHDTTHEWTHRHTPRENQTKVDSSSIRSSCTSTTPSEKSYHYPSTKKVHSTDHSSVFSRISDTTNTYIVSHRKHSQRVQGQKRQTQDKRSERLHIKQARAQ